MFVDERKVSRVHRTTDHAFVSTHMSGDWMPQALVVLLLDALLCNRDQAFEERLV